MSNLTLPHTANVRSRKPYTRKTPLGGVEEVPVRNRPNKIEGLACWVQTASSREIREHQKRNQEVTHKIYLDGYREDITIEDEITITAGPSYVGTTFKIRAMGDATAGLGVFFKIMVETERNS